MSISRNQIIGVVAALIIVVGGLLAYLLLQDSEQSNNQASQNESAQNSDSEQAATETEMFDAENFSSRAYTANITGTSEGESFEGTMEADGQGNTRFAFNSGGESGEMITTPNATYTCQSGECFKLGEGSGGISTFDQERYSYSDEDFARFEDNASYEGTDTCPAGTCDVWLVTDNDYQSTIYVSADSRLISKIEAESSGDTYTMVYSYGDVNITPPENFQELPTGLN